MTEKRRSSEGTEVPVVPKLPDTPPQTTSNPVIAICGECDREIRRCEGYPCSNARCPLNCHYIYAATVDYGHGDVSGPHYGVGPLRLGNSTSEP